MDARMAGGVVRQRVFRFSVPVLESQGKGLLMRGRDGGKSWRQKGREGGPCSTVGAGEGTRCLYLPALRLKNWPH